MKKAMIIAVLLAIITVAYAQIQPDISYQYHKTDILTGIIQDTITTSGLKQEIQKKHNKSHSTNSRSTSSFTAEEDNKDGFVNNLFIQNTAIVHETAPVYLSTNTDAIYKTKVNLTILRARK